MFIQTEATPNPATLKFIPGKPVLDQGTVEFLDPNASKSSPLAARLFEIEGVKGVFFGTDFISVTKGDGEWQQLKPAILGAIMEHYLSGEAVTEGEQTGSESSAGGEFYAPEDEEQDGGDITFQGYREGVVYLHMRGACSGCPSSTATLRHGIENLLRHFIPEVQEVRPV